LGACKFLADRAASENGSSIAWLVEKRGLTQEQARQKARELARTYWDDHEKGAADARRFWARTLGPLSRGQASCLRILLWIVVLLLAIPVAILFFGEVVALLLGS
jgi:hypothetical protein